MILLTRLAWLASSLAVLPYVPAAVPAEPLGRAVLAAPAAQDIPVPETAIDPEESRRQARRRRDLEQLLASGQIATTWEDPAALERGAAMLERLLAAAGGREAWQALPGMRLDVLEIRRVLLNRDTGRWGVHHYVPRACFFDLSGRGYTWSEFCDYKDEVPIAEYVREIFDGTTSWVEQGSIYARGERAALMAGAQVRKQFLLTTMPFSIVGLSGALAYARTESISPTPEVRSRRRAAAGTPAADAAPAAERTDVEVYLLHLPEELSIVMETEGREATNDFLLYVDPATASVIRLGYILTGADRHTHDAPYTWAQVDFEGELACDGLRLSAKRVQWSEDPLARTEWLSADAQSAALPPESLRKPWLGSPVYVPPYRADAWDPPAPAAPEPGAPETKDRAPASGADGEEPGADSGQRR